MMEERNFVFDKTRCNILIVDDSKTINKLLTKEFNKKNYTTFSAFSLKETREIINKQNIDYLILDINLPDGKGYELFEDLKNTNTKIFILTSQKDSVNRELSFKKGIIDFIIKDTLLYKKIEKIIEMIEKVEKNKNKNI